MSLGGQMQREAAPGQGQAEPAVTESLSQPSQSQPSIQVFMDFPAAGWQPSPAQQKGGATLTAQRWP